MDIPRTRQVDLTSITSDWIPRKKGWH